MLKSILAAFLLLSPAALLAELSLPNVFSDHMLLQRDTEAAIWGKADPGAEITVSFKGASAKAKADSEGRWKAQIATGAADATGVELIVTSGSDTVKIADVLVGEVWLASGQSNMSFRMTGALGGREVIAESNFPEIRTFVAPNVTAVDPQDDIEGEWMLATPETLPGYSAVAFFFTRKLHQELGIPVGMIVTAWGGKPVETFTSREALNSHPASKLLVDRAVAADAAYDPEKAKATYEAQLAKWEATVAEQKKKPATERKIPRKPAFARRALDTEGKAGVLFNSMINPFVGYTMQGAIWYQGEGNAKAGAVPYDESLPLMINDWRERWGDDISFYYVQLADFKEVATEPGNNDPWPLLQDRMRLVLDTTPKTGMAIINDIGDAKDIHPKNKHDVGERLALWALAKDYGQDIVYSGPLFKASEAKDGAIRVTFAQAGEGLKSRDGGELKRFEIAGDDKVWHWADAKIGGKNAVIVSCPDVEHPVAVRYAWAANPEGSNLVNSEGLPASIFRSDDWDDVLEE